MSTPDCPSASQICQCFRHILGKYSPRVHASVYSTQLPCVYRPWELHSRTVGFTVFKKPHAGVKEAPWSVKTSPWGVKQGSKTRTAASYHHGMRTHHMGFKISNPFILYNINPWQSAAECTSTQRWSAPNFTIFRILAKPQDYSVTGILRLESCMVDQIFTTHANDDPSTLNQILMD